MQKQSVEVPVRELVREPGELDVWPMWEVQVQVDDPSRPADEVIRVDFYARDREHVRALIEAAHPGIRVKGIVPVEECEGCETCLTFGGCGPFKVRELPRGENPSIWLGRLCNRLVLRDER